MEQRVRTDIKKTAAKLFLKYGLRSVSIDDICNELRISKKTFYIHFSQKDELIESVLMEHQDKHLRKQEHAFHPCRSKGNILDHLVEISVFHASTSRSQFANFFFDLYKYYPQIHERFVQKNRELICKNIRLTISMGVEENLFRTDMDVELMVRFFAMQFADLMNEGPKNRAKNNPHWGGDLLMDVFIRTMCNAQGLEYYERLLSEKSKSRPHGSDEPLRDEDLDKIIDHIIDDPEEAT